MIHRACVDNADEILTVINISNQQTYKDIIPKEYFKELILSTEKLREDMEKMAFYVYREAGRIVGVIALGSMGE